MLLYTLFSVPIFFLILSISTDAADNKEESLLHLTVASNATDGYKRFLRSATLNGYKTKVLGLGKPWLGGNLNFAAGGYKINLVKEELEKHKHKEDLIVLFTDGYDVIICGDQEELIKRFKTFNAKILFSAEDFCWPDESLAVKFPLVLHGYRYLNSGAYIGYAPQMYELFSKKLKDTDDDQLYCIKQYIDPDIRKRLEIKLDTQAKIFQNLHGNMEDVALDFQEDDTLLLNTVYQTAPLIIHGNGVSKNNLNSLGNYLVKSWTKFKGCLACSEGAIKLDEMKEEDYPTVLIGIFITKLTPFLEEVLNKVKDLNYNKKKLYIFVYNNEKHHDEEVLKWIETQKLEKYLGIKYISPSEGISIASAKDLAIDKCLLIECDAFFNVESEVMLDNPDVLKLLISYNRPVIAPIMTQYGRLWSTFWGAVTDDGYYARSSDYMDIVHYRRTGIWNVPYIYAVFLIWKSVLKDPETRPDFVRKNYDHDVAMAANFRKKGVFMFATNLETDYGHLLVLDTVSTDKLHNDMWQVAVNNHDWENKYLHPGYTEAVEETFKNQMPCTDVYWFPLFTEKFCTELIETMENYGDWSGGKNEDPRLAGGYENVPTDDIHMNQIGFEQEWLYILKTYIKPFAEKVYLGYNSEAKATMNFVVRYNAEHQPSLRPHHDSSTYTINVGLNTPGIDYEGGGSNFIRQNCSVTATKLGWAIMHPGRLTHYHEGLPTTKGTRYIMVSFIDP